jgi:hypothetical protein
MSAGSVPAEGCLRGPGGGLAVIDLGDEVFSVPLFPSRPGRAWLNNVERDGEAL